MNCCEQRGHGNVICFEEEIVKLTNARGDYIKAHGKTIRKSKHQRIIINVVFCSLAHQEKVRRCFANAMPDWKFMEVWRSNECILMR